MKCLRRVKSIPAYSRANTSHSPPPEFDTTDTGGGGGGPGSPHTHSLITDTRGGGGSWHGYRPVSQSSF